MKVIVMVYCMYGDKMECLTQVRMEKKEKAIAARAASDACSSGSSLGEVRLHWLAKKQNPTNQRNVQNPKVIGKYVGEITNTVFKKWFLVYLFQLHYILL